jgi:hypothetical protein
MSRYFVESQTKNQRDAVIGYLCDLAKEQLPPKCRFENDRIKRFLGKSEITEDSLVAFYKSRGGRTAADANAAHLFLVCQD